MQTRARRVAQRATSTTKAAAQRDGGSVSRRYPSKFSSTSVLLIANWKSAASNGKVLPGMLLSGSQKVVLAVLLVLAFGLTDAMQTAEKPPGSGSNQPVKKLPKCSVWRVTD